MTDLYLILHKVRGEPAFDIAEQIEIEGEDVAWIIPTSGHRAYPYWHEPLSNIGRRDIPSYDWAHICPPMPIDWPDHYQANASPKEERASADSLLASLGLPTKVHSAVSGKLTRRI